MEQKSRNRPHLIIILEAHWLPFSPICLSALCSLTNLGAFVHSICSVYNVLLHTSLFSSWLETFQLKPLLQGSLF